MIPLAKTNGGRKAAVTISTVKPTLSVESRGVARNSNEHEARPECADMQIA